MILTGDDLTLDSIAAELRSPGQLEISDGARALVLRSREVVNIVVKSGQTVYGVNTGFGRLANKRISSDKLDELQVNLLRSHAAGVGDYLEPDMVRLILLLKINSLLRGYSGIRLETVQGLMELYNHNLLPAIRKQGSVGASGDLAPLADLALPLIGEGQLLQADKAPVDSAPLLKVHGIKPLKLKEKEGLSLINGTQYSTALAIQALLKLKALFYTVSVAGAMSTEVMLGTDTAFIPEVQTARNQAGQKEAGRVLHTLMQESGFREAHINCDRVQDFYSLRCMPQVHGALLNLIHQTEKILVDEANSTTDNPVTLIGENRIVSGGNFHAAPIAHQLDFMAIALSDVVAMSERRIAAYQETAQSQLPMFLMEEAGLNSGFMIAHVTAAALTSENKGLAHPASVDTIPTSANQEDHVSMAPNAGHKLLKIIANANRVFAIEILCAAQARDLNSKYTLAPASEELYQLVRTEIPFQKIDGPLSAYIETIAQWIDRGMIQEIALRYVERGSL